MQSLFKQVEIFVRMSAVYFTSKKSQIEYNVIFGSHSDEVSCVIGCLNSRDRICRPKVEHGATFFQVVHNFP